MADMMWRLKRIARIEERRALALLNDLVEQTPEWQTRTRTRDLVTALDVVGQVVTTSKLPVPTKMIGGFLGGMRGVMQMLDGVRDALSVDLWPETEVCAFLSAHKMLTTEADSEVAVTDTFAALGDAATSLATAVRGLDPALTANVDRARTVIATECLLADDEDRRFERHRRILETSVARQLDLLAKVKALAEASSASGSFERPPPVELRVIRA